MLQVRHYFLPFSSLSHRSTYWRAVIRNQLLISLNLTLSTFSLQLTWSRLYASESLRKATFEFRPSGHISYIVNALQRYQVLTNYICRDKLQLVLMSVPRVNLFSTPPSLRDCAHIQIVGLLRFLRLNLMCVRRHKATAASESCCNSFCWAKDTVWTNACYWSNSRYRVQPEPLK